MIKHSNFINFRRANKSDFEILLKIISTSFENDPCFKWIIGSKNYRIKIRYLVKYILMETFAKGTIFISLDNQAAALWHSENKEKLSVSTILRDLSFLFKMGYGVVRRSLKMIKLKDKNIFDENSHLYLACIGVLPEGQGKGLASSLLDPILKEASHEKKNVYLETANPVNVNIYRKKGFEITNEVAVSGIKLVFMVKKFSE